MEGGDPRLRFPGSKEEKESLGLRLHGGLFLPISRACPSPLQVPPLLEPIRIRRRALECARVRPS